jgi:hypothetical protein
MTGALIRNILIGRSGVKLRVAVIRLAWITVRFQRLATISVTISDIIRSALLHHRRTLVLRAQNALILAHQSADVLNPAP